MAISNPIDETKRKPKSWLSIEEQCMLDILNSYLADQDLNGDIFPKDFDVDEFFTVASRQGVSLVISQILLASKVVLSESVRKKAKAQVLLGKLTSTLMGNEFKLILQELNRKSITPLVLKGFAAQSRYPGMLSRHFGDFDFQMSNDDIVKTHEILLENGYTTVDVTPDKALEKVFDKKSSPHLAPYVKRLSNGFSYVIELHRLDFYAFRGVPSDSFCKAAKPYRFDDQAVALRHTDEDLIIYSFLHFIRHEYALIGRVREGARLSHLLDGCILLKNIIPKLGWQRLLERIDELGITSWMYYAFLRARLLCASLFPEWVMNHLLKQLDSCTLISHPVVQDFVDHQCKFMELLLRPEQEMERMALKAKELREEGLYGKVYCWWGDNPQDIYRNKRHPNGVAIIDPDNVPEWNFYQTFISRANRINELRKVRAAFTWDDGNLYSYIYVDNNGLTKGSFNYLLDILLLEFYNEEQHLLTCKVTIGDDLTPNIVLRNEEVNISVPIDNDSSIEKQTMGYAAMIKVPVSLLQQHFSFTPHDGLELGFNLSLSDYSDEGEWTENRLDWSMNPANGVMVFTNKL